jgi:hypothetical protein
LLSTLFFKFFTQRRGDAEKRKMKKEKREKWDLSFFLCVFAPLREE